MIQPSLALTPDAWQQILGILLTPVSWIPAMQSVLMNFFLHSSSGWVAAGKFVFLLFPLMLFVCAIWSTHLSIYTLPFRSGRITFASQMLLAWWDAVRAVWFFWVGLFRIVVVTVGWALTLGRLALSFLVEALRRLLIAPFSMSGKLTRSYFQPGVPWIAFLLLIFWCLMESTIFTYTLFPTVSEVLADLVGMEVPRFTGVVLFMFLFLLIMGSFACLQALLDTVKNRQFKFVIQMIVVEMFVMFFEVMFLYRELVDAVTPWIAQQTSEQFRLGIGFTLTLATFGWVGIRGMTWFLFGQYGTPPLVAFISRRPMMHSEETEVASNWSEPVNWWRAPIQDFKQEIEWLHAKSDQILEVLTLPILHVLASALNFAMILLASRPVFSLPLKSLKEVMETREILAHLRLNPKRVGS